MHLSKSPPLKGFHSLKTCTVMWGVCNTSQMESTSFQGCLALFEEADGCWQVARLQPYHDSTLHSVQCLSDLYTHLLSIVMALRWPSHLAGLCWTHHASGIYKHNLWLQQEPYNIYGAVGCLVEVWHINICKGLAAQQVSPDLDSPTVQLPDS